MKSGLTITLICVFASIAVFGIFAMNHGNGHNGCLAAAARGMECPSAADLNSFLTFHLNAFKNFSGAILLLAGFLLTLGFITFSKINHLFLLRRQTSFRFPEFPSSSLFKKFIHWLSLHENSPSFAVGRCV